MSRILFIGAHTDEELCFAGAILNEKKKGNEPHYLAFSSCGSEELESECWDSLTTLGVDVNVWIHPFPVREFSNMRQLICDTLIDLDKIWNFETIVTHSELDVHPDHRTVGEESKRVFRKKNLLTYLGPWNGDEQSNYYIELTEQQLEKKIAALACYKSQSHRSYMSPDFIRAQAIYNGIKCGKRYAEAFRIEKLIN